MAENLNLAVSTAENKNPSQADRQIKAMNPKQVALVLRVALLKAAVFTTLAAPVKVADQAMQEMNPSPADLV